MKKIFTLISAALIAGAAMAADTQTLPASYLDGMLMLNEGWFGHDAATTAKEKYFIVCTRV